MPAKNKWRHPVGEKERGEIVRAVTARVVEQRLAAAAASPDSNALEYVINDTLFHEKQRAREEHSDETKAEMDFLKSTTHGLAAADDSKKKSMLEKLAHHYAEDVAGHFDPKVFAFTTKVLPYGLEMLFNAFSPAMFFKQFPNLPDLQARITIRGDIDHIRRLAKRGTLIVAPTHASNMDSLCVGWALNDVDLPPVSYGAGKGLFSNPMLSYFMNSLGAYKVDRLVRHSLYKEVLKQYSIVILERGYHSLFFPGGTRSRSGEIENKLKLGLLGTGLSAYVNNLLLDNPRPDIYIAPLTINYPIILEASTLIDDYLQDVGKSRYIILDDEFSKPAKMMNFAMKLMGSESSMALQFGPPLDPFGNRVDENGDTVDPHGRVVDARTYVTGADGAVRHDPARDAEYTRELGAELVDIYHTHTVALSTHTLAFTLFNMLRKDNPGADVYRILRFEGEGKSYAEREVLAWLERVVARLLELEAAGRIKIGGVLRPGECAREVMYAALRFFGMYHTTPVVVRRGGRLHINDLNLLLFYHNRLKGFGIEDVFKGGGDHE